VMKHLVIPDTQIRPGVPLDHLAACGNYIVAKRPDIIVQLGDFADMHSLSSYDQGKKAGEGARYEEDIKSAKEGMEALCSPMRELQNKQRRNKVRVYSPRMVVTLGNHENRIWRHVNNYPVLEGRLGVNDLGYEDEGWEVYPFLEVVKIDGIQYSHFFPRNAYGRIVQTRNGAPSAAAQVRREMCSSTAGHTQGLDYAVHATREGLYHGLIAGSFYLHEEAYLSPQGTAYWRGVIMKHEVHDGHYDPMFVSLNYLMRNYL